MKKIYVIRVKTPQNKYAHLYEEEVIDILRKTSDPYEAVIISDAEHIIILVTVLTSQMNVNSVVGEIKYNLGFDVDLQEVAE